MPLSLNTPSSARPQRLVWDPKNRDDAHQAGLRTGELLRQGWTPARPLSDAEIVGEQLMYPPTKPAYEGVMRVLDENGDSRVVWDRRDKNQVKEAFAKFKDFIVKGYRAYVVRGDGSRGSRLDEFDPLLEEILVGSRPEELVMVPATVPS
jgi:hypothetical protein